MAARVKNRCNHIFASVISFLTTSEGIQFYNLQSEEEWAYLSENESFWVYYSCVGQSINQSIKFIFVWLKITNYRRAIDVTCTEHNNKTVTRCCYILNWIWFTFIHWLIKVLFKAILAMVVGALGPLLISWQCQCLVLLSLMCSCLNWGLLCGVHWHNSSWCDCLLMCTTFQAASCSFNGKCNPLLSQTALLHLPFDSPSDLDDVHIPAHRGRWHVIALGLFCFIPQPPLIMSTGRADDEAALSCHQQQPRPAVELRRLLWE